jgi:hypothetical protein
VRDLNYEMGLRFESVMLEIVLGLPICIFM